MGIATLNDRERRFAEAWAVDPEHNGTHAAKAAGYNGSNATLAATASRLLKLDKVQAYIAELRADALAKVEAERQGTVATLARALEHATGVMELDITECLGDDGEPQMSKIRALPPEQRRALALEIATTTDENGQVFARHKLKRDPVALAASKVIIDHHEPLKGQPSGNTYVLNLTTLDPQMLRELYARGWLSAGPPLLEAK